MSVQDSKEHADSQLKKARNRLNLESPVGSMEEFDLRKAREHVEQAQKSLKDLTSEFEQKND